MLREAGILREEEIRIQAGPIALPRIGFPSTSIWNLWLKVVRNRDGSTTKPF
jgi:hypothetical protein